jgi:hypothetical protein
MRWIAERTFGWLIRLRHLVRDYEERIEYPEAMIYLSMEQTDACKNNNPDIFKTASKGRPILWFSNGETLALLGASD